MEDELEDPSPLMEPEKDEAEPIKEDKPSMLKSGLLTVQKTKRFLSDIKIEKSKALHMYIILVGYLAISILFILIEEWTFDDNFDSSYDNHKGVLIFFFIVSFLGSTILSGIVCYYECLIKTHLFGITLLVMLCFLNNYTLLFAKEKILGGLRETLALLFTLIGGYGGVLIFILRSEEDFLASWYLYLWSGLFSLGAGFVVWIIEKGAWTIILTIFAFFICEFNIYFSQFKFLICPSTKTRREKKTEILMYSQPFELNISVFKCFSFVVIYTIKFFRMCFNCDEESEKDKEDEREIEEKGEEEENREEGNQEQENKEEENREEENREEENMEEDGEEILK